MPCTSSGFYLSSCRHTPPASPILGTRGRCRLNWEASRSDLRDLRPNFSCSAAGSRLIISFPGGALQRPSVNNPPYKFLILFVLDSGIRVSPTQKFWAAGCDYYWVLKSSNRLMCLFSCRGLAFKPQRCQASPLRQRCLAKHGTSLFPSLLLTIEPQRRSSDNPPELRTERSYEVAAHPHA
jgi:hypothetical protein